MTAILALKSTRRQRKSRSVMTFQNIVATALDITVTGLPLEPDVSTFRVAP